MFARSLLVLTLSVMSVSAQETKNFAVVIHGGAGRVSKSPEHRTARQKTLEAALTEAENKLRAGADAIDVVEGVIRLLEDAPEFNAGKGSVLNAVSKHELDASIMDGKNQACGAVCGVRTIRHPISLARRVMTDTRHVLLATDGAEAFADKLGKEKIERVTNDWFTTERAQNGLKRAQASVGFPDEFRIGTVGCVALDQKGNIVAGTSTGGMTNKRFGRVGDSPIVGAGTYAHNETCGVSCTGTGEDFIRHAIAFQVHAQLKYTDRTLDEAVKTLLEDKQHPISGGIIAISKTGEISMQFNTDAMSRAAANSSGQHEVHVAE